MKLLRIFVSNTLRILIYLCLRYCFIDPIELLTIQEENLHYQKCWLLFDYCNALLNKHYFQSCAKFSVISSAQTSQTSTISWDRIMGHSKALLPLLWNQLKEKGCVHWLPLVFKKVYEYSTFCQKMGFMVRTGLPGHPSWLASGLAWIAWKIYSFKKRFPGIKWHLITSFMWTWNLLVYLDIKNFCRVFSQVLGWINLVRVSAKISCSISLIQNPNPKSLTQVPALSPCSDYSPQNPRALEVRLLVCSKATFVLPGISEVLFYNTAYSKQNIWDASDEASYEALND